VAIASLFWYSQKVDVHFYLAEVTEEKTAVATPGDEHGGPLRDVRVADLSRMLTGPYATTILGDLGADVIKVESPAGDPIRGMAPLINGQSHYHLSVNRSKRSVVADLRSDEGRELVARLIATSDVVVENFRPGVMSEMGLAPEVLLDRHPELIVCSISGFGATGPLSDRPSLDLAAQAVSGLMSVTGTPGTEPVRIGVPIADLTAGLYATIAILGALRERERSGRGQHIDLSMQDALVSLLVNLGGNYFANGESVGPVGSGHPTTVPYGAYQARDGHLVLAVATTQQWRSLCEALGLDHLAADKDLERYDARTKARARIDAEIGRRLETGTVAEWCEALDRANVPCAPILDVAQVLEDEHLRARGMVGELVHESYGRFRQVSSPLRLLGMDRSQAQAPPMLGEHTEEIVTELS
jgi:crotonobetainyl-CoA:carnitine CoA-transferase CaiB-like acyl-CoA transferase